MKTKTSRVIHWSHGFRLLLSQVKGINWGGLVWYWLPLLAFATGIIYLSSLSVPAQELAVLLNAVNALIPGEGNVFSLMNDKFYHMVEYAILAILAYRAFCYSSNKKSEVFIGLLTVGVVVLFGCTDEIHQWFTPFRHTDSWDLVADALGGLIGVSLWQRALSIPVIRLLEERIPLKLQVALGI